MKGGGGGQGTLNRKIFMQEGKFDWGGERGEGTLNPKL